MKRRVAILALLVVLVLPAHGSEPEQAQAPKEIFEEFFEEFLELHPSYASTIGDRRYNTRLTLDILPEHRQRQSDLYERTRTALARLDRTGLTDRQRLHVDALDHGLESYLEGLRFDHHLLPLAPGITLQARFPQMGSGRGTHPFETVRDYDDFLARIDDFSSWVDAAIANMRSGAAAGIVQPRSLIEAVLPELEGQFRVKVEKSPFYLPIENMPADLATADRERLDAAYREAIVQRLMPAYRRLHRFLKREYLPATRDTISLSALPGGRDAYRALARSFTTTEMAPEEIFELGLAEIARIEGEMTALKKRSRFAGSLPSFRRQLSADPRNYHRSREQVFAGFEEIRARVSEALPRLFPRIPKTGFDVRQVEPYRAATAPGAFYERPSADGARPGTFYVNIRGQTYPRYTMETLFLHEALPGHHLQIALAQEQDELPRFLRHGYFGAFVEGWGLYAEGLGRELGLYTDAVQYYGRLVYDLGRASRLVADVGIHHRGWTRREALDFLGERHLDWAIREIDRYVAMPGQALSYKVGEREILNLRRRAETVLGERFDVRRFHHELLRDGPLPIAVLKQKIDRWIATERTR
ncbi:MAG: DUF885 domain-containing protein [bacterium]|nr:DUF885 domain-containing protein [bacterium]